jgi:putative endonuclease
MPAAGPAPRRQAAYRRGHQAEWAAAALLVAKGFTILARRHAGHGGEIDIVARRRGLLVFVEVKQRSDLDAAALSITAEKRRRFARAARHYLARNPWAAAMTVRCDAVFLAPWRWPRHVPDAFRLDE